MYLAYPSKSPMKWMCGFFDKDQIVNIQFFTTAEPFLTYLEAGEVLVFPMYSKVTM